MRYLLITLWTVVLCTSVFAQKGTLTGTITDRDNGDRLIGVNIIADENNGTTSNIDGKYYLTLKPGWHWVDFKYIGYSIVHRRVKIDAGDTTTLNVRMFMEAENLGIVTVSASKYEKEFGEESVTVEVLTPEFIENSNSVTLDAALNKVPGVNMIGETVNIRGGAGYTSTAGSRVLMLLDGIPLLTGHSGGIEFGSLPMENVKQVEITKGAASTLYGSSALNGVINFITATPKEEPYTKITTFYGLYENPFKGDNKEKYWADGKIKQQFGGVSLVHRRRIKRFDLGLSSAYNKDDSYLFNAKKQRARINLNMRYRPRNMDNLTVGLNGNFAYLQEEFFFLWAGWEDTTGVGDSLGYVPNAIDDMSRIPISLDPYITYFDKKDNKHSIKGRWYRNMNRSSNGENTNSDLVFGEYTFHSQWKQLGINFVTGVAANFATIDSEVFGQRKSKNGAVFVQLDKKFFDKLTLTGGFRLELFKLDSLDVTFKPIGRGGINYQIAEATYIRASAGMGYRYPSISERFPVLQRAGQLVVPNDSLKAEKSWSFEIGIKQGFKISKWVGYLDLSGFVTQYYDMMEFTFAPQELKDKYFPDAGIFQFPFWSKNVTDARISGIEFSALGQGKIGSVEVNYLIGYMYLVPIDLNFDEDNPPANNPERTSNMLNYRFRHSGKADIEATYKGFALGMTGYINSFMTNVDPLIELPLSPTTNGIRTFRDHNEEPAYFVDARIAYTINDAAKVALIAKNLTNNMYSLRPGYIEAPRNYTLQLSYEF